MGKACEGFINPGAYETALSGFHDGGEGTQPIATGAESRAADVGRIGARNPGVGPTGARGNEGEA